MTQDTKLLIEKLRANAESVDSLTRKIIDFAGPAQLLALGLPARSSDLFVSETGNVCREAATLIESLEARIEEAESVVRSFANSWVISRAGWNYSELERLRGAASRFLSKGEGVGG